ncbi:MAG: hypothetical protein Q7T55_26475, partial [Solirubrobacteraceae bacterium]|nr:hypothetical protein [Solirubrobacteraceae bacterium]
VNKSGDYHDYSGTNIELYNKTNKTIGAFDIWGDSGGSNYYFYSLNRYLEIDVNNNAVAWKNLSDSQNYGAVWIMGDNPGNLGQFQYYYFPPNSTSGIPVMDFGSGGYRLNLLSGTGNDYACLDSTGKLFRSNTAC